MKRKVILHGPSSLTISLPSKWVKENDIGKGDELDINLLGNSLRVSTNKINYSSGYNIDLNNISDRNLNSILACLHKNGYNVINIKCNSKQVRTIQKRINSMLIGYEIVEVTTEGCTIKTISEDDKLDFKEIFKKIFLINLSISQSVIDVLEKKEFDSVDDILVLEETNNRITNYVQRKITQDFSSRDKSSILYLISWLQEKVADNFKKIILEISKEKKDLESFSLIFKKVHKLLEILYDLFYEFSLSKVELFRQEKEILKKDVISFFKGSKTQYKSDLYSEINITINNLSLFTGPITAYSF
jgi:phosphate uptake regulator